MFDKEPDQVIINEYEPGQGISPHIDCKPCFGPVIASLTLQSPTFMVLYLGYDRSNSFTIQLTPRSLLLLEREAWFDFADYALDTGEKVDGAPVLLCPETALLAKE